MDEEKTDRSVTEPPKLDPKPMGPQPQSRVQFSASQYQGPFPPPLLMAEFEKLYPGASKQWFEQWKAQTDSRLAMEKHEMDLARIEQAFTHRIAEKAINTERLGLFLAFLVTAGGLGLAGYFASINLTAGVTAMLGQLVLLAGVFVAKKVFERKEGQ